MSMKALVDEFKVLTLKNYIKENPTHNLKSISYHFCINSPTLHAFMKKHNITCTRQRANRFTNEFVNELIDYISKSPDLSQAEIADTWAVSSSFIGKFIKKHNLNYTRKSSHHLGKGKSRNIGKEELIIDYINTHPEQCMQEIADEFKMSRSYVFFIIKRNNINYTKKAGNRSKKRR